MQIKGILITNPSNPLGAAIPESALLSVLRFAAARRLHVVCDEVYAGTAYASPSFADISSLLAAHRSLDRSLVHIVSSLSKTFGLPGFRVGLIYSHNDSVVACARAMSSFGLVSTQTQRLLSLMLADEEFVTNYLAESARRVGERRGRFVGGAGIRVLEGDAGLFCWMDLRRFLKKDGLEGEMELWKVILEDVKINVSPGSAFRCGEAGWFRACFANMEEGVMAEALRRIRVFVDGEKKRVRRKRMMMRYLDGGLRLSLPGRFEEAAAVMSPRSPLVHASS